MTQRMIKVKINTKGFEKFNRNMTRALKDGLRKSALVVERKAKIYSPVDTGTLRRSIKTERVEGEIDGFSVTIAPSVSYAAAVEFGGKKPRKQGRIPYMRPALRDSEGQIRNIMTNEIRRRTR